MAKKHLEQHIRGHNGTLKKYKKKPAPGGSSRKRKLEDSAVETATAAAPFQEPEEDDKPLDPPFRPNIIRLNDAVVTHSNTPTATTSMLDTWNNSTQNPYFALPGNPVIQRPQYPHPPGLDLSQGGHIFTALHSHQHNTFVSDRYSYT